MPKRLYFNSRYRLRKEEGRVLLYKTDSSSRTEAESFMFVHPLVAVVLAMFDRGARVDQVVGAFSFACDLDKAKGRKFVEYTLRDVQSKIGEDLLVAEPPRPRPYSCEPTDFVMPADEVKVHSDPRLLAPLGISWDLTHRCGRRCLYCYAETDFSPIRRQLHLDRIREIIAEAASLQVGGLLFGGGDPFARKEIVEILGAAAAAGIPYFVSTKAFLSRSTSGRLKDAGVELVQVSLDAADPATADFLTGSPGFLHEALETIRNLQGAGIEVKCKAVVTSYNVEGIPNLLRMLAAMGIENIHVTAYGRSIYRHSDELFASWEALERLGDEVAAFRDRHPECSVLYGGYSEPQEREETLEEKAAKFVKRSLCTAGRQGLHILPDGRVLPCEQLPTRPEFIVGDLSRSSLAEVWNSAELRRWYQPERVAFEGRQCSNCPDFDECVYTKGRCFRNAYNVFGDAWAPDPQCPYIKETPRLS